ncbi:MAG TPA: rhodanese-like domain-containing protein [Thermoplasmatales archaeon]|nr:rhodanese-like domain-containing protein [Thermoplasmatales archaeon]
MRGLLILFVVSLICFPSIAETTITGGDASRATTVNEFTHTVFVEFAGVTWCPHCPSASERLYEIYTSGEYPFYYVSFVRDKNPVASERMKRYFDWYIPMAYFDGGFIAEGNKNRYEVALEESGSRVVHNIELKSNVTWLGDARIRVDVMIRNLENKVYIGWLTSYVTEKVSRWMDVEGLPFHFGFLDYALNEPLIIPPSSMYVTSVIWDGGELHGNQTFEDIAMDNIMVISTVTHWRPHIGKNPWDEPKPLRYLAFYVDETMATQPVEELVEKKTSYQGIINVTVDEVWELLESTDTMEIPVDVRTRGEYIGERIKTPHLYDRPRLYPLQLLQKNLYLKLFINWYSGKEIILYCRSGNRSYRAAKLLFENNFNGVIYNMVGGIKAWKAAGYPTTKGLKPFAC